MSGGDVSRNMAVGELVVPAADVWQSLGAVADDAVLMGGNVGRSSCWNLKATVAPVGFVMCVRRGVVGDVVLGVRVTARGRGGLKVKHQAKARSHDFARSHASHTT